MFGLRFLLFNLLVIFLFFAGAKGWLDQLLEFFSTITAALLRLLRAAFPRMDELTVFVIATTFLLIDFADPSLRPDHSGFVVPWIDSFVHFIKDSWTQQPVGETALQIIVYLIISTFIFGPFLLPFTRWNLRPLCIPYIMLDAGVIATTNRLHWHETNSELNLLLYLYSCAWLVYIVLVLLHPRLKKTETLIPQAQANAWLALICASVACITIEVLIRQFSWHWIEAYTSATLAASYVASVVTAIVQRIRNTHYHPLPQSPE